MIVSIHSLCICVAIAHAIGWYVLCVDFAPLSVRTLRLVPWRLIHAVLRGTEDSGKGVRRQVCVCVKSVRHLQVTGICVTSRILPPWSNVAEMSGNLETASAGLGVGPNVGIVEVALRQNCAAPVGHW